MRVVDASVACKWFLEEPDSGLADALLGDAEPLTAPSLLLAEVLNVIWLRRRRGATVASNDAVLRLLNVSVALVPLDDLAARAAEWASRIDHPVYDCFYLALAEREQAELVTADRRLAAAVAGSGGTKWVRLLV